MRPLKALAFALGLLAVASVVAGTGGFSTVSADRAVSVAVVENDEAYVGVTACEKATRPNSSTANASEKAAGAAGAGVEGKTPLRVHVTNQYSSTVTVVSIASADADRTDTGRRRAVDAGEAERFEPVFGDDVDTVRVEVRGDNFHASTTRPVHSADDCPR